MDFVEKWFPAKIMENPQKCSLAISLDPPKHLLVTMKLLPDLFTLGMFTRTKPLDQIQVWVVPLTHPELFEGLIFVQIYHLKVIVLFLGITFNLILQNQIGRKKQRI